MFKVGDIAIGLPQAPYCWTGPGTRNEVINVDDEEGYITVELLDDCDAKGVQFDVKPEYFALPNSNETALYLLNKEE